MKNAAWQIFYDGVPTGRPPSVCLDHLRKRSARTPAGMAHVQECPENQPPQPCDDCQAEALKR